MSEIQPAKITTDFSILSVRKTKDKLPLPMLFRLVLRYVYDRKNCMSEDVSRMTNSITNWADWIKFKKNDLAAKIGYKTVYEDPRPIGTKGSEVDEVEFQICGFAWLLRENDEGRLEARKESFKKHDIDYRKFYKLPEAYRPSDFKRAKAALEKAMKDNPEDYE